MNCCDYDCNQGRDCPARKPATCPHCHGIGYDASGHPCTCTMPANVAKVGTRMHGPEPLPTITWRDYLGDLARAMLFVIAILLIVGATILIAGAVTMGLVRA